MLLIVEKGIRGGICHFINKFAKANNQYMRDYNKNKELSYFKYTNVDILYGRTISQKLPVHGFEQVENLSEFDEGFVKSYNEKSKEGYFLEIDIHYLF